MLMKSDLTLSSSSFSSCCDMHLKMHLHDIRRFIFSLSIAVSAVERNGHVLEKAAIMRYSWTSMTIDAEGQFNILLGYF